MPATTSSLLEENALLGSIIDDLRKQGGGQQDLEQKLRATEDALLDMHAECKATRSELRAEQDALRKARAALDEGRRGMAMLQGRLRVEAAAHRVTQCALIAEVARLERQWVGALDRGYASRLREAAETAVRGMHDAQAECRFLHEQLQSMLRDGGGGSTARVAAAAAAAVPGSSEGAAGPRDGAASGSMLQPHQSAAASPREGEGSSPNRESEEMRTQYVLSVQRCHQLQVHLARVADEGEELRPQLARALERVSTLQAEVDRLRSEREERRRRAAGLPPPSLLPVPSATAARGLTPGCATPSLPRDTTAAAAAAAAVTDEEHRPFVSVWTQPPPPPPPILAEELSPPLHASFMHSSLTALGGSHGRDAGARASRRGSGGSGGGLRGGGGGGGGGGDGGHAAVSSPPSAHARVPLNDAAALRGAVVQLRAQLGELEQELACRRAAHQADLEALCRAHADAAASAHTLRSERAWVSSLDEMRISDLKTIAQLEQRLHQWGLWNGGERGLEAENADLPSPPDRGDLW